MKIKFSLFLLLISSLSLTAQRTANISLSATCDSSVQWNGSVDTNFANINNWGVTPCFYLPSCTIDAIIAPTASGNQPTIFASMNATVKDLQIDSGGVLRILAGGILNVCGNFTNNGILIASYGSTIRFIGSVSQTISGKLTGTNAFANLTIDKPASSGNVSLNNDIDVKQKFLTSNGTSIFSINGKYMKVGGDFTNANGTTTFTGITGSTIEFNGTTNQIFFNDTGSIEFNNVKMNKASGKLYLASINSSINIDSTLTLDAGIIVTRNFPNLEVNILYFLPAALQGHPSSISYIDGKLRRKISNGPFSSPPIPASYDFPVGDSLSPGGYEKANITFKQATLITDLQATFTPWPLVPTQGPFAYECFQETYSNLPIFNNGYWTFLRGGSNVNGRYSITLFNTGFTNNFGLGWTVAKADLTSNPSLASSWGLIGDCVINSTPGATSRANINSSPGTDSLCFNHRYATVQTDNALPVEQLYFKNISGIELFPNPANSIINYKFSYSENIELIESILDVSGRIIRKEKINVVKGMNYFTKKIDDLVPGVYMLRISGAKNESVDLQVQFLKN